MLKERPRVRTDGVYICKMHYVKFGYNEQSEYRPSFDVISYRYLIFNEDGNSMQIYTPEEPDKFVDKIQQKEHSKALEKFMSNIHV